MFNNALGLGNTRLFAPNSRAKLDDKAVLTLLNTVCIKDFNDVELRKSVFVCIHVH